jgi:hypothetical protein
MMLLEIAHGYCRQLMTIKNDSGILWPKYFISANECFHHFNVVNWVGIQFHWLNPPGDPVVVMSNRVLIVISQS